MLTPDIPFFNPLAVEAAEHARLSAAQSGEPIQLGAAYALAQRGLSPNGYVYQTESDFLTAASRPEQVEVMACLARIAVDSQLALAKDTQTPDRVYRHLVLAGADISRIYRNQTVSRALQGVEKDHLGRAHSFLAEMARDEARLAEDAALLVAPDRSNLLRILSYKKLMEGVGLTKHQPTRAFLHLEAHLLTAKNEAKVDEDLFSQAFLNLMAAGADVNQERRTVMLARVMEHQPLLNRRTREFCLQEWQRLVEDPQASALYVNEAKKLKEQTGRRVRLIREHDSLTNQQQNQLYQLALGTPAA